jgi:hypothetical protein
MSTLSLSMKGVSMNDSPMTPEIVLTGQPVATSVAELLAGATDRQPMAQGAESLSTATFERVVIDGDRYILKHLHCDDDWIMRATGDVICRPVELWRHGFMHALPDCLDHTVAGVATGEGRHGWGGAVLMHDRGECFVPDDDTLISVEQHERFLDHMAALHARFWGFRDPLGIIGDGTRLLIFNEWLPGIEERLQSHAGPPRVVEQGYANMAETSPATYELARDLFADPSPLLVALAATPRTFIHSDWKLGNLGSHADGRTVIVDWAFPGEGSGCTDLAWYLGVNCRRLPTSREDTIGTYRRALVAHGVDTDDWWDAQLGLALIGCFLQQGWSKTLDGRDDEFTWWESRTLEATRYLT